MAVDRLARLPLAGRLHRARVELGVKAGVIPGKAARGDDPADRRFGLACQILVLDLDETIGWKHAAPMVGQTLVAPKIGDQLGTACWKGEARIEQRLMD